MDSGRATDLPVQSQNKARFQSLADLPSGDESAANLSNAGSVRMHLTDGRELIAFDWPARHSTDLRPGGRRLCRE